MFEGLSRGLDALAAVDLAGLSDGALLAGVEELLVLESRLRAEQARWLRATEVREASVAECGRPTRSWLVEELRLSPGEARRRLLLTRLLAAAPEAEQALRRGEISAEHALTVAKAVADTPADARATVAGALVDLARAATPGDVAAAVDAVRARLGLDDGAAAAYARRYAERGVELDTTFGGFGSLGGTLSPDVTETLRIALDAAAAKAGPEDERTVRQRRHDGLGELAAFYLAHAELAEGAGERPRLVVTLSYEALSDELEQRWASLDSGAAVAPATVRRLACDAEVLPAVLGGRGEVLDRGRTTRVFTAAIRRAAHPRQRGSCAFGGCGRRVAECHHVQWWSRGGSTSLDNAAWLCAFHHWLVHEGGWAMRAGSDGFTFVDRTGREHRFRRRPEAA